MKQEDIIKFGATFIAGGVATYMAFNVIIPKVKVRLDFFQALASYVCSPVQAKIL